MIFLCFKTGISRLTVKWLAVLLLASMPAILMAQDSKNTRIQYDEVNGYSLAFVEADVKRVVDAVMGSMLGASYTIDPDVSGNITLRTVKPVTEDSLIPLLEQALASIDAVIVKRGDGYRVIDRAKARALAPITSSRIASAGNTAPASGNAVPRRFVPSAPGFATEVVTLEFGSAAEIAKLIQGFLGDNIAEPSRDGFNNLLITGNAEERDAAKKLIGRFDVDNLSNMNFEIYRLENVDADTLVGELDEIFAPPYDIIGSRVRLVPLPRLRSVLGISANRADLSRIEPWIRRLDAGGSGKRKLYSYAVQNGRAADIASSLQLVLGNGEQTVPQSNGPARIDVSGGATQDDGNESSPAATPSNSGFFPSASAGLSSGLRIVPNAQNNSLLIYANGEEYGFIRDALEKLDQPVAQVLIEATLAEVTLSDDLRFGLDFSIFRSGSNGTNTITSSGNESGTPASSFPGFSVSVIGSTASAVLNTLQSKTDVRVLSAPKILTLNNEPATLQVGDQVPIVTQQSQGVVSPGAPLVNNIELRDTGVILQVTPRVNDSGTIILDISQEVSDVAETTTSGINSPTIQQRRLASTVATRSGEMIALGGLIRNRQTKIKSGIPLLSQIPLIGGLFGRDIDTGARTELIILITPTVIRSPEETQNIVNALIDGLDLTRPLVDQAIEGQVGGRQP
ncbi:general secretion pathway protein D [Parasphingorhabdus marina DSM 22363]|uniref:General secretion pathway protein D n=1 Tax=Parasphingorhabdus marina DSM 22363 TaxID=1123272 RepID=A0A1N6HLA0_9SPHN|nr:type II secretion system secretin GspD [Parasphingorhabdus marina]SIO20533.1 general secretion pathway protein D [Parasphingorhabdus marina DSM 22363]